MDYATAAQFAIAFLVGVDLVCLVVLVCLCGFRRDEWIADAPDWVERFEYVGPTVVRGRQCPGVLVGNMHDI